MATSGRVEPGAERARRVGRAGAAPQAGCRWCPGDLHAVTPLRLPSAEVTVTVTIAPSAIATWCPKRDV